MKHISIRHFAALAALVLSTLCLFGMAPAARAQNAPSILLSLSGGGDGINKSAALNCGHGEDPGDPLLYRFNTAVVTYSGTARYGGFLTSLPQSFSVTTTFALGGTNNEAALINIANARFMGTGCAFSFDGTVTAVITTTQIRIKNGVTYTTTVYLGSNSITVHLNPDFSQLTYQDPYLHGASTTHP